MKRTRNQTVGKIQFIIESHFMKDNSISAKDLLKKIMLNKANEILKSKDKSKMTIA